jgi:SNF2 family DNA or RNA helicase
VVAPLSTLTHWYREFTRWTDLNTIVYHGSAEDRRVLREYEFAYECDRPEREVAFNQSYLKKCANKSTTKADSPWMIDIVITSPETMITDDVRELTAVEWEVLVVDEAHRLKNYNSKLAVGLRNDKFSFRHRILMTGYVGAVVFRSCLSILLTSLICRTPIQNDVKEFWTLLNFIEPDHFDSLDDFMKKYGDMKTKERVDELHEEIRPYILRRLKEDVERSVPPKEETLIEVELTIAQKQYYRALYEKNVKFLNKNKKKPLDGPSLNNLAMQLRKCCNHLFLLNGIENEFRRQQKEGLSEADFLVRGSGKLVLLDKLLPRLKQEGHRVLLFSQFKIMLDILEDYLNAREMKFERIDGSITGNRRQQAIDRFQTPSTADKEAPFIMLLSTRAGGRCR